MPPVTVAPKNDGVMQNVAETKGKPSEQLA